MKKLTIPIPGKEYLLSFSRLIKCSILSIFLLFAISSTGQENYPDSTILKYRIDSNTYALDANLDLSTYDFITRHRNLLNISTNDSIVYKGFTVDSTDQLVDIRFSQKHLGIPVDKVFANFTEQDNKLWTIMGNLVKGINASNTPIVSNAVSLDSALKATGADTFLYQLPDTTLQDIYGDSVGDPSVTASNYYPSGTLVYTWQTNQKNGSDYVLAWRYEIGAYVPRESYEVYINATNGHLIKINSMSVACGQNGSCNTLYNGSQIISANWRGAFSWNYNLSDCVNIIANIHTKWYSPHAWTREITSSSDNWAYEDQHGTTCHWGAETARDYWYNTWGIKGLDNNKAGVTVMVDDDELSDNSRFDTKSNVIQVGTLSSNGSTVGALDIMGHEYTHGVSKYTAGFTQDPESWALNESFSDIFGTLVKRYVTGSVNWTFGSDLPSAFRSLSSPGSYGASGSYTGDPDTYLGTNWRSTATTTADDFAHHNNGVQNNWFYNLSNAIGIDKAAAITKRNLFTHLFSTANYMNSAIGSVQAAKELYGECSNEAYQTALAWQNRGLGVSYVGNCVSINGPGSLCSAYIGQNVNYKYTAVTSVPGIIQYIWHVDYIGTAPTVIPPSPTSNTLTIVSFNDNNPITVTVQVVFATGTISVSKNVNIINTCRVAPVLFGNQINPDSWGLVGSLQSSFKETGNSKQFVQPIPTLKIYPNPANDKLFISLPYQDDEIQLTVFDMSGQLRKKMTINQSTNIDVNDLSSGVYQFHFCSKSYNTVQKVIICH